ncbi:MAG: TerC family protein [Armatimonadetes bacterium]|nr:TerC family protein [Armatimonadota bacterium]
MFGQTVQLADFAVVAVLVGLEILLSADNALVLAIMVKHLPKKLQQKALLYGLGGAFVFRLIAILFAKQIMALWWLQAIGAVYLLILPIKHFVKKSAGKDVKPVGSSFWGTVVAVEVTDIAFAVDSVLAGVAVVKSQDKIWVVYLGAIIGVIALRFAAGYFVRLLERFPALDHVAYLLVGWVGVKLSFMAGHNYGVNEVKLGRTPAFSVHELSPAIFWGVLALIAVAGATYAYLHKATPEEVSEIDELEERADTLEDAMERRTEDLSADAP